MTDLKAIFGHENLLKSDCFLLKIKVLIKVLNIY